MAQLAFSIRSLFPCRRTSPFCVLLQVQDHRVLFDIGWDGKDDPSQFTEVEKEIRKGPIDLLVLSHATLDNLGGFVYARQTLGLRCPVISTVPVAHLGHSLLVDHLRLRNSPLRLF